MSDNSLTKKSSWEFTLDEFNTNILKEVFLNSQIPEYIRMEIENIKDLLLHSYYNNNFIDDAYTKAIFVLEKVLRIRSKELNNGVEGKNLASLFKWFFENNYFETTEITELHQLRNIRNRKVHDSEIFKGFLNFLINIYSIFDLMNDVYEDVDLRLKRRDKTKLINDQLNNFYNNGFILEIDGLSYFGHFVSILFYNNKATANILHLRIARCIVSDVAQVGIDRENFELIDWNFNNEQFTGQLKTGKTITIKPLTDRKHIEQFQNWLYEYPLWSLELFDSLEKSTHQEKLREFYKTT